MSEPDPKVLRKSVVEMLELLASEEQQLQYEANVPHVDVTDELVCMWFDDAFIVDSKYLKAGFSDQEWEHLLQFHRFYDSRERTLPDSNGTVRTWLANPMWREIMAEAGSTLSKLAAQQCAAGNARNARA